MKQIVWRSVFLSILAAGGIFWSFLHYYFNYRDISQLLIFLGFFSLVFYLAYDQWIKNIHSRHIEENYQAINALNQKILLMEARSNEHHPNN